MQQTKSFAIGDKTYNVVRATAIQQDELLSLLTQGLIARMAAVDGGSIPDSTLVMMFSSMSFDIKRRIDSLMLSQVVLNGTNQTITAADFQSRMMELNTLRSQVLKWNFEDFFTYWASEYQKEQQRVALENRKTV